MSFSDRLFTIKTTVGKEYKEPKGRNGGAMLKLEYDKKEIEGVIDKIVKKTMNMVSPGTGPVVWHITESAMPMKRQARRNIWIC